MTFGRTHVYIWGDPDAAAGWVGRYAEAIFAGRFQEVGRRAGRARLHLADGQARTIGSFGLPVDWHPKRRRRTYAAYS